MSWTKWELWKAIEQQIIQPILRIIYKYIWSIRFNQIKFTRVSLFPMTSHVTKFHSFIYLGCLISLSTDYK